MIHGIEHITKIAQNMHDKIHSLYRIFIIINVHFPFFDIFSKALNKIAISSKFHSEKIKWEKLQNFPSTNAFLICMKIREKEIKKKT